jgi:hypothetical protein
MVVRSNCYRDWNDDSVGTNSSIGTKAHVTRPRSDGTDPAKQKNKKLTDSAKQKDKKTVFLFLDILFDCLFY